MRHRGFLVRSFFGFFLFFFLGVVGDRGRGRLEQIQKRCLWRVVHEVRGEERRVEFSLQSFETSFFLTTLFVSGSICYDFHENLLLVTQTSEVSSFRCKAQLLWFLFSSEFLVVCFPESVHFFDGDGWLLD